MAKSYFDYASTTPADPQVIRAMEPYFFERFGNASSPHGFGREAKKALEEAREILASFLGAQPAEMTFTSGATEANNLAILGAARSYRDRGRHIVVSNIEHHSVLKPIQFLESEGFRVTYVNVDAQGLVDPAAIAQAITDQTILIAVMHASNEIGTIQPVKEIGRIAREKGIPFLVDAVQTVGHIPVNVEDLGADLLSLSAHKFYGPKGIGALYHRQGIKLSRHLWGGDQERGLRASTQNVAGAVGLAKAVQLARQKMDEETEAQSRWRDQIIAGVSTRVKDVKLNGHPTERLPNNAHFSFTGVQGETLLMSLDMAGISTSMGSACTAGAMEPSHVLRAIGLPDELAFGSLRFSIGRWTTQKDVDDLLTQLPPMVERLRV